MCMILKHPKFFTGRKKSDHVAECYQINEKTRSTILYIAVYQQLSFLILKNVP